MNITECPGRKLGPYHFAFKRVDVEVLSSAGTPYFRGINIGMPRIHDSALDCVFYLYKTRDDAIKGTDHGGTGFFVSVPSERFPHIGYVYAVTNKHVAIDKGFSAIRINKIDGSVDCFDTDPVQWESLANLDIAVYSAFSLNSEIHKYSHIPTSFFATDELVLKESIGIGDDAFMIGRFINHDGKLVNLAAARFGNISVMPTIINYAGYANESYCIDLHSRPGFSGSPVFVYRLPGADFEANEKHGRMVLESSFLYFLGIHWGQFPEDWEIKENIVPTKYVRGVSGMTMVIPAQKILDLLNVEKLKMRRTVDDQERTIEECFPPVILE